MDIEQQHRITIETERIANYSRRIDAHLARTWEEDDPEITGTTRETAALLGMSAAELWKSMELWSLVSGRQIARHRLDRIERDGTDCR